MHHRQCLIRGKNDLPILRIEPDQAVILAGVENAISNYQLRHGVNERIRVPDEFPTPRTNGKQTRTIVPNSRIQRNSLHLDELSIFRILTWDLLQPREHILAHMGHDQSFRLQFVQMGHQGAKIQVKFDLLLEKVRLCNQEVGSLRCWQEGLGPFRIARVGDTFPVTLHAQGQGRVTRGVLHAVGGDDHFTQCLRLIGC